MSVDTMNEHQDVDGIAIVGMAGRLPGAPDVATYWSNLCAGVESVRPSSEAELRAAGVDTSEPGFVNAGAAMDGIEQFDADFFGMNRREAEVTDPQHRVLLETAWATLEHAGYDPGAAEGRIGIFGGAAPNMYFRHNLLAHPHLLARIGPTPLLLATEREYAITRVAYKLALKGPAVSVLTACSTSAVAAHLATQSLLSGECDLALAGGVNIRLPDGGGYIYQEDGILSADGQVRAFDADARGTVMASGVAFVALKRLADAVEDNDTIYAVIRGSAINNDGAAKAGFTAPSVEGQAAVIGDALAVADVDADSIGMVEAHGTGTSLGDPVEVTALTQAYRHYTNRRQYCAIGSLKSNVGHLDAAAGAAGIIKVALALYHELIPPSINFHSPNPQIDFEASPFFVNTELRAWKRGDEPRRAAVSSFGFGGTNAHLVLEEAPQPAPVADAAPAPPQVLTLSARTAEALERRRQDLADHLASSPETDIADAAYTLAVGRSRMPHRAAIVATDSAMAVEMLRHPEPHATTSRLSSVTGAEVGFLFTGQGAQYPGMGAELYRSEPIFAEAMQECAGIVGAIDGHDLLDLLYGEHDDPAAASQRIMQTAVGQPAIFALQYALSRLWASWGVTPSVMVGHSVGELAAACIGGVFTLEDALHIIVARGRLMQELPIGAMTAILADEAAVTPLLDAQTSLAAVNAPEQCVASGLPASIEELERQLDAGGISFRRLPTDRAFHSPMMEPAIGPLQDEVARVARADPTVPMVSTMTGAWATAAELADPAYWGQHARRTVRFMDAAGVLLSERPGMILLEVGPGETLRSLASQHRDVSPDSVAVSTLPHRGSKTDDRIYARRTLADVWAAGADVDLLAVNGGRRCRVPLPTYPFARERYWIEGVPTESMAAASTVPDESMAQVADVPQPETSGRKERIALQLTSILADLSGLDGDTIDVTASFTDLGFDSLFLTQANSQIRKELGVRVTLGQLFGPTPTVEALATRIDAELGPEAMAAPTDAQVAQIRAAPAAGGNGEHPLADKVDRLVTEQLKIMDQQLELMRSRVNGAPGVGSSADETHQLPHEMAGLRVRSG